MPRLSVSGFTEMQPKQTFDELKLEISAQHNKLSKRLRQIAEFAIAEPDQMALETVAAIAARADVQPSSLIRFAKQFGYEGFSDMQRVFRSRLIDRASSYSQRIRESNSPTQGPTQGSPQGSTRGLARPLGTPMNALQSFISADIEALEHLKREVRQGDLERAVDLLAECDIVGITAHRRSFPIAAYLAYGLSHLGRRTLLVDAIGGLAGEQTRLLTPKDALIAISFKPYAPETLTVIHAAEAQGAKVIAITDTALSPLVPLANVRFEVEEAQVQGIRSLTAATCLAASLVIALGQRLETRAAKRRSSPAL